MRRTAARFTGNQADENPRWWSWTTTRPSSPFQYPSRFVAHVARFPGTGAAFT
jgi:hypothetical protein